VTGFSTTADLAGNTRAANAWGTGIVVDDRIVVEASGNVCHLRAIVDEQLKRGRQRIAPQVLEDLLRTGARAELPKALQIPEAAPASILTSALRHI
jgi:hypothetical protein